MIYIITPVFNRKEFTKTYLQALSKQTFKEFKIIVIDDGSTDGTSEMIENKFPNVILLKEKGDLWWAEATNVGIRYALEQKDVTYILTLNDDTIPFENYLENMHYWSTKKPNALLGTTALDIETNKIVYGGEQISWEYGGKIVNLLDIIPESDRNGLHGANYIHGRGFLIPIQVFNEVGLYDSKNFPQTVADHDFSLRADRAGYEIYCNYDARIYIHLEESGGIQLINNKSWKNFYKHLFGMKGAGNLKWFTVFALKNAPKKHFILFWLNGVSRRIGGYLIRWIKEIRDV